MKTKLLFLLLALPILAAGMSGCDEKGSDPQPQTGVVGHWEMTDVEVDTDAGGVLGDALGEAVAMPDGISFEFKEDGTMIINVPGTGPVPGTWELKGNKLTMTQMGTPQVFDVLKVDSQYLVLFVDAMPMLRLMENEFEALMAQYGMPVDLSKITKFNITQTFERRLEI